MSIIMGSKSDWETMRAASEMLTEFGVAHECRVVSAHRTPELMAEFAAGAEGRGIEVIIAGAGGAAHLPGMTAAHTTLPVLGVPIESRALKGLDSLLSIVQMPAGVPVATLAIGTAGREERGAAGGGDPGEQAPAAAREAESFPRTTEAQSTRRTALLNGVTDRSSRLDHRCARQRPTRAACSPSRRAGWAIGCTRIRPIAIRPRARSPMSKSTLLMRISTACGNSLRPSMW